MRRYAWIIGAFLIVVVLIVVEIKIIAGATAEEVKVGLVFAKRAIEKNTVITGEMLEIKEVCKELVHPDSLQEIATVTGKWAYVNIEAGEMILKAKLLPDAPLLLEALNRENRLYSVAFDSDQANGWQIVDGGYADIIFVPSESQRQSSTQPSGSASVTASTSAFDNNGLDAVIDAANVRVLKNIRIAGLVDGEGQLVDMLKKKGVPKIISFEVTEEQAAFLAWAKRNGKLEICWIPNRGGDIVGDTP